MNHMNKLISPRTPAQIKYLQILRDYNKPLVIATGPAGTGKTLFACQDAIEKLSSKHIDRVVLTRPIVAVDEELGFLPGGIEMKMDPWTRPMFDIMQNYYSDRKISQMIDSRTIEISPLGYMRGRTFDNCYVIADEMQNSTTNQLKMLMTRIGNNSKMVVTGDVDQCDLRNTLSGLADFIHRIDNIELQRIEHVILGIDDVQRHKVVKEILDIYKSNDVISDNIFNR